MVYKIINLLCTAHVTGLGTPDRLLGLQLKGIQNYDKNFWRGV